MPGTSKSIYSEHLRQIITYQRIMKNHPNDKELQRITRQEIRLKSRDNSRTPMQWDNTKHAGFSSAAPWQAENPSYKTINAALQVGIEGSVFEYWAAILRLRKTHKDVLIYGDFELIDEGNNDVFAYTRSFEKEKVLVVANFRKEHISWEVPSSLTLEAGKVFISNYDGIDVEDRKVELRPFEAFASFVK
jgi:glycosidase